MKITKRDLRKMIIESVRDIMLEDTDTGGQEREFGGSSFQRAQADAKKIGKSYFVKNDGRTYVFDKSGNANMIKDFNSDEALKSKDCTIHYEGDL